MKGFWLGHSSATVDQARGFLVLDFSGS